MTADPTVTRCASCALKLCVDPGEPRPGVSSGPAVEDTPQKRKEIGQGLALNAAEAKWRDAALDEIRRLAHVGSTFTSETVTMLVGLPTGSTKMNRNNAVGALMSHAARMKLIVKTGRYVPSQRKRSHGAMLAEWRGR